MYHRPLVFIDIETTGAAWRDSRVLEVGAIRLEAGKIVKKYKQLINPEAYIPPFITGLTGITEDHVWNEPTFADIALELQALLADAVFVAHNVGFDYGFIKHEFEQLNVPFVQDRLCTVRLSRALYPAQKSHRLDEVIRIHGYQVASRHRAYDDAEVLYKFYRDHLALHGDNLHGIMNRLITPA